MRGFTAAVLACAGLLATAPAASPHPGHGPVQISIADFSYTPQNVNIFTGDSVVFVWNGPDTNHTATSATFDTDSGKSSDQVSHKAGDSYGVSFYQPGTFTYQCKVHSFMTGTINVQQSAAAPPPNDPGPALTKVTVRPAKFRRATTLRWELNIPASMRAQLRKKTKVVKEFDFNSPPGAGSKKLTFSKKVKPGKYVLRVVAVDQVNGKSSKPASVRVTVRG